MKLDIVESADNTLDNLRDYQIVAVQQVIEKYKAGINEQLIELPTGCGKTHIAAAIANQFYDDSQRILFITHREEIIEQAAITIGKSVGIVPGIVKAEKNQYKEPIILCSIQSLSSRRRQEIIEYSAISVIIIDECHHFTETNSYGRFLNAVREIHDDILMVGMSATPYRNDSIRITDTFEPIFARSIERMQRDGWLANHIWKRIIIEEMNIEIIPQSTIGGEKDFKISNLADEVIDHLDYIAKSSSELIDNRQTIVFACNIQHMHKLVELYYKYGINAGAIWGDMSKDDRKDILKEWRDKKIQLVVNVGVLTEGFDYPEISAVVIARPTMSPSLYVQMIGRGLRIIENKKNCLIIDYTGRPSMAEMGFTKTWKPMQIMLPDILGNREPNKEENGDRISERRVRSFEKWSGLPFSWIPEFDSYVISVMIDRISYTFAIINDLKTGLYIPVQIINRKIKRLTNPTILRRAVGFMDEYLRRIGVHGQFLTTKARWRKSIPSAKQLAFLKKLNNNNSIPDEWMAGEVGDQITILTTMDAIRQFLKIPDKARILRNKQRRDELIEKGVLSNSRES